VANYRDSTIYFTQNKKQGFYYALINLQENEPIPQSITWHNNSPKKGTKIKLLQTGESLKWTKHGNVTRVFLPLSFIKTNKKAPAIALSFIPAEIS
jgi:alpha-L-fucosidase